MPLTGTLVNFAAIVAGSLIGFLFRKGLPEKYLDVLMQALGLVVLALGVKYAIETRDLLCLIISVISGTMLGTALRLHDRLDKFGESLRVRLKSGNERFAEGFVTSALLFCSGAMGVTGAIQGGLSNDHSLLFLKSVLDGVTSVFFASAMGFGVLFSGVVLLLYQGGFALGAHALSGVLTADMLGEMTAAGGILLIALSLSMLNIKKPKVTDMLPSIFLPIAVLPLVRLLTGLF